MKRTILAVLLAMSMIAVTAPTAMAADVAGASGSCHDGEGNGGDGHVAVTDDPDVSTDGLVDTEDPENNPPENGVAAAVAELAVGLAENQDPAEACQSPGDDDYIEAHVAGEQVCYDGEIVTDGSCETRP